MAGRPFLSFEEAQARRRRQPRPPHHVHIPDWVKKAGLDEDYRDHVMAFNINYAVAVCKQLIKGI